MASSPSQADANRAAYRLYEASGFTITQDQLAVMMAIWLKHGGSWDMATNTKEG
jgi:hypothetical protein